MIHKKSGLGIIFYLHFFIHFLTFSLKLTLNSSNTEKSKYSIEVSVHFVLLSLGKNYMEYEDKQQMFPKVDKGTD